MTQPYQQLQAVVFDWAGTMIDYGSRAPASVFQAIFERRGVAITSAQAREPMGMAKRDHIVAVGAMPEVAARWQEVHGREFAETDVDAMYEEFLPLQKSVLGDHSQLIPGAADAAAECRRRGLKIGSSTGYTRELMEVVAPASAAQGYEPDCALCAEDASRGRPAPFLLFEAAQRLGVYPMWRVVKVDDTPVGIEAGKNAGTWTVGVTLSGNGVGLSEDEVSHLTSEERASRIKSASDRLSGAGADYLIESVAEITRVLEEIDERLGKGERPRPNK